MLGKPSLGQWAGKDSEKSTQQRALLHSNVNKHSPKAGQIELSSERERLQIQQGRDELGTVFMRVTTGANMLGHCSSGSAQQTKEASGTALAPDDRLALRLGILAAHFTPDILPKRQQRQGTGNQKHSVTERSHGKEAEKSQVGCNGAEQTRLKSEGCPVTVRQAEREHTTTKLMATLAPTIKHT